MAEFSVKLLRAGSNTIHHGGFRGRWCSFCQDFHSVDELIRIQKGMKASYWCPVKVRREHERRTAYRHLPWYLQNFIDDKRAPKGISPQRFPTFHKRRASA